MVFVSDDVSESDLSRTGTPSAAVDLAVQRAAPFLEAAVAGSTRRAYASAWLAWCDWCRWHHTPAAPADPLAVAGYLAGLAQRGLSVSSVRSALAAIQYGHRDLGHRLDRKTPVVAQMLAGITRKVSRPVASAPALELEDLRLLIRSIDDDDIRACRDRAMFLLGFFGALRRSELASLDVTGRSPAVLTQRGVLLHLSGTKTSPATVTVALPSRTDDLCPARALAQYLAVADLCDGPLLRAISKSGQLLARRLDASSIAYILKARLSRLDGLTQRGFSAHSLRAGFATSAARAGMPEVFIQRVTRHRSADVLRRYVRSSDPFRDSAGRWL